MKNTQQLYNTIINNIAKHVKKTLNESIDFNSIEDDEDTVISSAQKINDEIIKFCTLYNLSSPNFFDNCISDNKLNLLSNDALELLKECYYTACAIGKYGLLHFSNPYGIYIIQSDYGTNDILFNFENTDLYEIKAYLSNIIDDIPSRSDAALSNMIAINNEIRYNHKIKVLGFKVITDTITNDKFNFSDYSQDFIIIKTQDNPVANAIYDAFIVNIEE